MSKKIIIIIGSIILLFILCILVFTGKVRTDVYLKDFKLSEDNRSIILKIGVSKNNGYVRKFKEESDGNKKYYTFYSTYGLNSKIESKDSFEIKIDQNTDEIYFNDGTDENKLVLIKDKRFSWENNWKKINYTENGTYKLDLTKLSDTKKIVINTYALNDNAFLVTDSASILEIYNTFKNLETTVDSKTVNPETTEEQYYISFYDSDDEFSLNTKSLDIYRKNNKYYAEQRYNGIYEITEDTFNQIKSYIKSDNLISDF